MWAAKDSNLRLPPCECVGTTTEPPTPQALTPTPSAACTAACTSEAENANADALDQGDSLAKLATTLAGLSQAERERLAAMLLIGQQPEQKVGANDCPIFRQTIWGPQAPRK